MKDHEKKSLFLLLPILLLVLIAGCSNNKTVDKGTNKLKDTVETGASDMKKQQEHYWDSSD